MNFTQAITFWTEAVAPADGQPLPERLLTADPVAELVAAVRHGGRDSDAAARRLVEEMYPTVIRIIRAHLPARMDEEDLAQDVFLKMFHKLHQFRGERPFSHWLSRLTTNTCLDALRRQKVRPEVRFADLTEGEQAVLMQFAGEEMAEETNPAPEESSQVVDKLLLNLKPDQQVVLRLLDIEQKSVKEICNQTGWSASKVKVTAMRARRHLTDVLSRLGKSFLS